MAEQNTLGAYLAGMLPQEVEPRCPKCGGRLLMTVTLYAHVPIRLTVYGGASSTADLQPTKHLRETKAELAEQATQDQMIDERDELYCEHFSHFGDGCDYWTTVGALCDRITARPARRTAEGD